VRAANAPRSRELFREPRQGWGFGARSLELVVADAVPQQLDEPLDVTAADRIGGRLNHLSTRLGDADWLDGAFSAGDLMMVSVLLRSRPSGILDEYPKLAAYVARGEARPAYERAFAAQLAINPAKPSPG